MALRQVGFFRDLRHGRPDGPSLADRRGMISGPEDLVRYLESGVNLVATGGTVAADVLDPEHPPIGRLSLLTDGVWVWPSDLAHYVGVYGVDPGAPFRAHVAATEGLVRCDLDDDALGALADEEWLPE